MFCVLCMVHDASRYDSVPGRAWWAKRRMDGRGAGDSPDTGPGTVPVPAVGVGVPGCSVLLSARELSSPPPSFPPIVPPTLALLAVAVALELDAISSDMAAGPDDDSADPDPDPDAPADVEVDVEDGAAELEVPAVALAAAPSLSMSVTCTRKSPSTTGSSFERREFRVD
jgi:hypothetical protein